MDIVVANGFSELTSNDLLDVNGGVGPVLAFVIGAAVFVAGAVVGWLIYEGANAICVDLTGKTIGKYVADKFWPAD